MHLIKLEVSHWTLNVWCDFFYVYKKEVQKMNDLIELKLITREDAECLHKLQIEAFRPEYSGSF